MKKLTDTFIKLVGLLWYPNISRKVDDVEDAPNV